MDRSTANDDPTLPFFPRVEMAPSEKYEWLASQRARDAASASAPAPAPAQRPAAAAPALWLMAGVVSASGLATLVWAFETLV